MYPNQNRGKLFKRVDEMWGLRTVILLSPLMILVGFLLIYIAFFSSFFTSVLHDKTPLFKSDVAAFGIILITMGIVAPIARLWQESRRRR